VVLFQVLDSSLWPSRMVVAWLLQQQVGSVQRTGLTGADGLTCVLDRSDRCWSGSELCCFSGAVCVCSLWWEVWVVPRISSTSVATWSWQTRGVAEVIWDFGRVHLARGAISFEKIFYQLSFTPPPSLVAQSGTSRAI
jgi:precorrin-6B methylase 1